MNFQAMQVWSLLAGLGLFLFGMYMMEEALKILAGRSFKVFLRKHTNNSVKAVLSGTLITAILQSSSMVSLLVMSFAGAGIIGLKNGIGIIMGANLGTTVTGWLVTLIGFKLNLGAIILPFLAIGGLGIIFLKTEKLANLSKLLMGFSFMFLGIDYMKNGVAGYAENFDMSFLADKHPLFFLLAGLILSSSIQSSSAAMMIFLSSLAAGMITLHQGFYLVLGGDLGTTITAVIGTINGNSIRKKVGWSQFSFNIFNVSIALLLMNVYIYLLLDVFKISDNLIALVAFHSLLNLAGIFYILPFLKSFTKFIDKVVKHKDTQLAKNLMLVNPHETHAATEALEKECIAFVQRAIQVNSLFFRLSTLKTKTAAEAYFELKAHESEVVEFHMMLQQNKLTPEEVTSINNRVATVRNATLSAKDLKDIRHNLDELSNAASQEFYDFYKKIRQNQDHFYQELKTIIAHRSVSSQADIEQLAKVQLTFYQEEVDTLYSFFSKHKETELTIPSLLNMIRKINSSNEALLRATGNLTMKLPV